MNAPLATYVDRQGKPVSPPAAIDYESLDVVKTAKFFMALGLTAEKSTTTEGRQFILARASGLALSIIPSRTPRPIDGWSMTLVVADAAQACAKATAAGGTIANPVTEIPGGKKCALVSPEGYRVVLAERRSAPTPTTTPSSTLTPRPTLSPQPVAAQAGATPAVKPVIFDAIVSELEAEPQEMRTLKVGAMSNTSSATDDEDAEAADEGSKVRYVADSDLDSLRRLRRAAGLTAAAWAVSIVLIVVCVVLTSSVPTFFPNREVRTGDRNLIVILAIPSLIGGLAIALAKWPCRRLMSTRIGNSVLITIAFYLDLGTLGFALLSTLSEILKLPPLAILALIGNSLCAFVSPILFLSYLSQASRFVESPKLASSMRMVQLCLYFFVGFVALEFVGVAIRGNSRDMSEMLALAGLGGMILTGVLGFFGYVIVLSMFAATLNPTIGRKIAE